MKKSLKAKCSTKTSHMTWTLYIKIWAICLYNLYIKYQVHVIWLVFYKFGLNIFPWGISSYLLVKKHNYKEQYGVKVEEIGKVVKEGDHNRKKLELKEAENF